MAPESHKDLHGPSRAYWHYLEHAATQAARAEAAIAALDGQFLTMERQCALPRRPGLSKAKRRASSTAAVLPADSVQDAVEDFADKNPLKKIRVSPRYGKVNGRLLGLHVPVGGQKKKNLEMQGEVANNKFKMVEYRKTMQRPCFAAREQRPLRTCALVAWDQRQRRAVEYTKPDGTRKTLRVELWGPEEALELWSRWCAWCEANVFNMQKVAGLGKPPAHPYPVMIPTKGRAKDAHLNWSAPHVFGDVGVPPACGTAAADDAPTPLAVAVVEPGESAAYRETWPQQLLMVLPDNDVGISFVRWAIQHVCAASREEPSAAADLGPVQRLTCVWVADDNLTCFYRLESERPAASIQAKKGPGPNERPHRVRVSTGPMFAEAFREAQRLLAGSDFAIVGFLRDDGMACIKKKWWVTDNTSLFKVVLLNLLELRRLHVEYLPQLTMFEDVCINAQVRNCGGRLLKCMRYCYWADTKRAGGCEWQRSARKAARGFTDVQDLISEQARSQLSPAARSAVQQVAAWLKRDERMTAERQQQISARAAASASSSAAAESTPPADGEGAPRPKRAMATPSCALAAKVAKRRRSVLKKTKAAATVRPVIAMVEKTSATPAACGAEAEDVVKDSNVSGTEEPSLRWSRSLSSGACSVELDDE
eukprot:gnl/TRDRNA2_/TRDRNA2_166024_c6_seq4.p1 gnl/TRDRNA2_/TRDRNA2_166024_c6~~gnl/TRDRNA2_/TRDRNA2_166024_c6_seq4.p1  ORF type:complete len:651 (+),score=128.65 gnl/TRDRNA2_/TRDRNA2_166024_c6_seq4:72-2024(+)